MIIVWAILISLLLAAFLVPMLNNTNPNYQYLSQRLAPPSWIPTRLNALGMDDLGRPLLLRILYGLRTSFSVAFLAVFIAGAFGTTVGLVAGDFGGWADTILMRVLDIQMSMPALLVAMSLVAFFGGTPLSLAFFLALNSWLLFARVVRSGVLTLKHNEFVLATIGIGASSRRIMFTHLLPNVVPTVLATGTFALAEIMLAEAGLSYIGLGIQPPAISLGSILSEGQTFISTSWWVSAFSGGTLALTVLTCNLAANWLRAELDPRRA